MLWSLAGALIITYGCSRALLLVARNRLSGSLYLFALHLLSWLIIACSVGLLRRNMLQAFDASAGLVYIAPQVFWYLTDLYRRVLRPARV